MSSDNDEVSVESVPGSLAVIARPLADHKLQKRVLKLIKKSAKDKTLKRGVKEVVKAIRKSHKGLVVMAGDISPIDVLSHVPVLCEDAGIPYVFLRSKAEVGSAASTRRPTCCVMIPTASGDSEAKKSFEKCTKEIAGLGA